MPHPAAIVLSVLLGLLLLLLFAIEAGSILMQLMGFAFLRRCRTRAPVRDDGNTFLKSPLVPSVAVAAAPPDASPDSIAFVHELVKLHSADHEVLVILDAPPEDDLAIWFTEFRLFPSSRSASGDIPTKTVNGVYESRDPIRLMVIEKEAGGEADCLNVAVNLSGAPLLAVADVRSHVVPDILLHLLRPFLERPDVTLAACAMVPPPGTGGFAPRFQALESIRSWLGRSAGLASHRAVLPAPGSFYVFDRQCLREANGFFSGPFEMIFHLHALYRARQKDYRIEWVHLPLAVPKALRSMAELSRQVQSDQREITVALSRHWAVLGGFGSLGRLAVPGLISTRVIRPFAESLGYLLALLGLATGWTPWQLPLLLLLLTCGFGTLNSMLAVLLRESVIDSGLSGPQVMSLFAAAIPENFGWRQWKTVRQVLAFRRR